MGQAGQGGGCPAFFFLGGGSGQDRPQDPSWSTSAQLGSCQSWAGLSSCRPAMSWQVFCMMLMRAAAGEEGEAMLLSCTCPCWRVL